MSSDKYCKIHWIPTTAVRNNFACIFGNKLSTNDLDLTRCVWAGFSFSVQRLFVPTIANPGAIGYTCACFFAPGWRKGRKRRNGSNSIVFPYLRQLPVDQEQKRTACLHAHVFGHVSIKPAKVVFKIVGHQTWDECLELRIFHVFFSCGRSCNRFSYGPARNMSHGYQRVAGACRSSHDNFTWDFIR